MVAEVLERIPVNCGRRVYYVVKVEGKRENVTLKLEGDEIFYILDYPDITIQEKHEIIAFLRKYESDLRQSNSQNNP